MELSTAAEHLIVNSCLYGLPVLGAFPMCDKGLDLEVSYISL